MRAYHDRQEQWIVGVFRTWDRSIYMAWDGCGDYGETYPPMAAEKFDSAKEARAFLRKDEQGKEWKQWHPDARVFKMTTTVNVYPLR